MRLPNFPTREQKDEVIATIRERLKEDLEKDIRQAYEICITLLESNEENKYFIAEEEGEIEEANDIYREQLLPLKVLPSVRSRVLAIMCVDYLNGNEDSKVFTQIGLKPLDVLYLNS